MKMSDVQGLIARFEEISGQRVRDWTSFETLETTDPLLMGKALDEVIVGELTRQFEQHSIIRAVYIRDLAALLVELRQMMM